MKSNNQQEQKIFACESCGEIMTSAGFGKKCTNCSIAAFREDDNDDMPNLEGLTIDDILSQDDPPRDLYLCDEKLVDEKEVTDDVDEDTFWMIQYNEEDDDFFDIYQHFGIPDDLDDDEAEAMLDAAIPDRG
jgi:hypothetical protein